MSTSFVAVEHFLNNRRENVRYASACRRAAEEIFFEGRDRLKHIGHRDSASIS